ncbi:hypothetical protein CCW43_18310 [Salmonella enterica]|nr:hypothetical protein [Salmonella enterica subsp. enterica serovar Panama]EDI1627922.1 hypothetical protein [Salmonella enterica]
MCFIQFRQRRVTLFHIHNRRGLLTGYTVCGAVIVAPANRFLVIMVSSPGQYDHQQGHSKNSNPLHVSPVRLKASHHQRMA